MRERDGDGDGDGDLDVKLRFYGREAVMIARANNPRSMSNPLPSTYAENRSAQLILHHFICLHAELRLYSTTHPSYDAGLASSVFPATASAVTEFGAAATSSGAGAATAAAPGLGVGV